MKTNSVEKGTKMDKCVNLLGAKFQMQEIRCNIIFQYQKIVFRIKKIQLELEKLKLISVTGNLDKCQRPEVLQCVLFVVLTVFISSAQLVQYFSILNHLNFSDGAWTHQKFMNIDFYLRWIIISAWVRDSAKQHLFNSFEFRSLFLNIMFSS